MRNIKISFGLFLITLFSLILFTGGGTEKFEIIENKYTDNVTKHLLCIRKRDLPVTGKWLFLG